MTTATKKATPTKPAAKPTEAQLVAYVEQNYGYLAAFLDIPDVKKTLLAAAGGKWDAAKLQGALYKTSWWKKTSESMRQWETLRSQDPASYKQRIDQTRVELVHAAQQMGVGLSGKEAAELAVNINKFGWSGTQITAAISSHYKYKPDGQRPGAAAVDVATLKQQAAQYMVPLSDGTIEAWTRNMLNGTATQETFDAYLREQAKSLFPTMAAQIDAGITVAQYVDPYRETAAKLLDVNPADVDFMQPKWQKALTQVDPKTGQRVPMNLADWQTTLMNDPVYGYDKSRAGVGAAGELMHGLAKMFGTEG